MRSCDTNVLFPACDRDSPLQARARRFLEDNGPRDDFVLSEQVLMELYCLLRNPAVCRTPLGAAEAVGVVHRLRSNPRWRIVDAGAGRSIMDAVWARAAERGFACRRIFDIRLACVLRHHGVTEFATRNTRDFAGCGFARVWDPLAAVGT